MPVNETLDLQRNLRAELGLGLDRLFMNGLYPELFSDDEAGTLRERLEHEESNGANGADVAVLRRAALRAAVSEHRRAGAQRAQLERLARDSGERPVELPFLFRAQLDMDAVEDLADVIEEQL
jgi:hypothetical protein